MTWLNFLWHFHQPDYRHPGSGIPQLPWVRLHAVRGYSDLLSVLERSPGARVTVNFSGVLLEQLEDYAQQGAEDSWAQLSAIPAAELSAEQRAFISANFFSANAANLIDPQPRYRELQAKAAAGEQLSEGELGDLQVWFNLAWIGFSGRRRPEVQALLAQGSGFTNQEAQRVLEIHREVARGVLPGLRALAEAGRIELSVTPYQHPILPLLVDLAAEGRRTETDLLPEFRYPADAREQVLRGKQVFARSFGHEPRGVWPAEGAVSDAALAILAAEGVEWIATDQANLAGQGELAHFTPWRWRQAGRELCVFFRDTRLSDNIGFEYAHWRGEDAAGHLVHMARAAAEQSGLATPVASIVLDGENPWENYFDGGESFLTALFAAIERDPLAECRPAGELAVHAEWPELCSIHSGSWIYGNFDIWTRHSDTRRAWRLLAHARSQLAPLMEKDEVRDNLLVAEGSDWFWWYGDDFVNAQAWLFDELFRGRLQAAYAAAAVAPPPELYDPLLLTAQVEPRQPEPGGIVDAVLDGRISSFFEWRGAARLDITSRQGSMARASSEDLTGLYYGYSESALWLRLDLSERWLAALQGSGGWLRLEFSAADLSRDLTLRLGSQLAVEAIAEVLIPLESLGPGHGQLELSLLCAAANGEMLRIPAQGNVTLCSPADFAASHWLV